MNSTAKDLLASTSLAAFLGQRPPSTVVTVSSKDKLEHVLRLFASRDILSAPVVEASSLSSAPPRCLGFVGVDDVLRAVLSFAGFSSSPSASASTSAAAAAAAALHATVLASSTPAAREEGLRRASERLCSTSVSEIQCQGDGRLVFQCSTQRRKGRGRGRGGGGGGGGSEEEETSLLGVVRDGFLLGGKRGQPACHRVAVCDFEDDDEDDDDGNDDGSEKMKTSPSPSANDDPPLPPPPPRVVAIVSQSDVVRFLARHPEVFESSNNVTARDLASSPVAAVPAAMAASLAFASLFEKNEKEEEGNTLSAAAIVGTQGELVGSLSASDLRGLSPATLRALGLPVGEFVQARARAAAAAAAAAADDGETGAATAGAPTPPPLLAVGPETPLSELVRLLAEGGHHRAFVVEEENDGDGNSGGGGGGEEGPKKNRRATGVVSLGDVLRFVCKG